MRGILSIVQVCGSHRKGCLGKKENMKEPKSEYWFVEIRPHPNLEGFLDDSGDIICMNYSNVIIIPPANYVLGVYCLHVVCHLQGLPSKSCLLTIFLFYPESQQESQGCRILAREIEDLYYWPKLLYCHGTVCWNWQKTARLLWGIFYFTFIP